MPISLIDNFKINTNLPIDGRTIATNSTDRDSIRYKYDGLKVFQSDTRLTYVWNKSKYLDTGLTATSWDSDVSEINGQGSVNYVAKWDLTGLGLTNSSIICSATGFNEVNQKVGIGGTANEAFQVNSNYSTSTIGTSSMPFVIHKGASTII